MQLLKRHHWIFRLLYIDSLCVLIAASGISLLLELLRPGFISGGIDITMLWGLTVIAYAAGMAAGFYRVPLDRMQNRFLKVAGITGAVLLWFVISLQFSRHLLGLVMATILVALLILNFYLLHDRRRRD